MSVSIAKNIVMTYFSLHLIANKTLELVYENAPECTILKFKKIQNFLGQPIPTSIPLGAYGASSLSRSALDPPVLF